MSGDAPGRRGDAAAVEDGAAAGPPAGPDDDELRAVGRAHFERTAEVSDRFFGARADDVSRACWDMARRFHRGGRLLVFAPEGPGTSDAYHVSVEFVHPVLVGKRALPAVALDGIPAQRIRVLGRDVDIALGLSVTGDDEPVLDALREAGERGLLTVGLAGSGGGRMGGLALDHLFAIEEADPATVQEVHETLYHVLWELVHVFFDHETLL